MVYNIYIYIQYTYYVFTKNFSKCCEVSRSKKVAVHLPTRVKGCRRESQHLETRACFQLENELAAAEWRWGRVGYQFERKITSVVHY